MIKQGIFVLKVDQEINIAIGMHLPTDQGTKDGHFVRAALARKLHNLRTQAADIF